MSQLADLRESRGLCIVSQAPSVNRTETAGPGATTPSQCRGRVCVRNEPAQGPGYEHGLSRADLIGRQRNGSVSQAASAVTNNSTAVGPEPDGLTVGSRQSRVVLRNSGSPTAKRLVN